MSALNKISDAKFRNLKASTKEQVFTDGGGLVVRIRPIEAGGSISFRLTYRIEGKQKWMTLGSYPSMTLKEAREARDKHKSVLREGRDPFLDKILDKKRQYELQLAEQAEIAKQQARMTVNNLYESWESLDLSIRRKDKGKSINRFFNKDILPVIGNMAVEDIRKNHIAIILDNLITRKVPRTAKMALTLMRQMFRFAQDRDYIDNDPTRSLSKAKTAGKDIIRDRYLDEDEIKKLKDQLPRANVLKTTECAIWIILSTCCRIGELSKAKWEDIDLEAGTWKIPAANSKNGKAHLIYLSEFAKRNFETLSELKKSKTWVYPNTDDTKHVSEKSITKQIGDRQLQPNRQRLSGRSKQCEALVLTGGKWHCHDLRRTAATLMGDLGVRPDVIELCLNHVEVNRMKRTYQHQKLLVERSEAWRLLGERLELLTSDNSTNVLIGNFKAVA